MHAVELTNITARYGKTKALDDISLHIAQGEAMALLGPNGAGKTTAMRLLTGLKKVQAGKALVFGNNPREPKTRARIGVMPQDTSFPQNLTVREILNFTRAHFTTPIAQDEIIEAFQLQGHLNKRATRLSGGQQRNFAVALAFCGGADAVFLDEPTTGLDLAARRRIWAYLARYKAGGGSLFLTTHYIEEAELNADRIVLLTEGRIADEGAVADIRARVNVREIRFRSDAKPVLTAATLHSVSGNTYTFLSSDADAAVCELVDSGQEFAQLVVLPASLEQAISGHWGDAA